MELIDKIGTPLLLIITLLSTIYSGFKVVYSSQETTKKLKEFDEQYSEHMKDFNALKVDVAYIKGRLDV